MDLWHPPTDQPHLLEWWRPLLLVSRAARLERHPWPIHMDDMMLMGRVDRSSRPSVWIYKHVESRRELYIDAAGQTYKFTRTRNTTSYGRFTTCSIATAIWRAELPAFVEPVWYEEPRRASGETWRAAGHPDELDAADPPADPTPEIRAPRRRGHLTVLDGGRSLAG